MKLLDYLHGQSITYKAFAEQVGTHTTTVFRWAKGDIVPSLVQASKVEKITGGLVTAADFLPDQEAAP